MIIAPKDLIAPFVEGRSMPSNSEACTEVINPSDGCPILSIPIGCEADVDRAVASARGAFEDGRWSAAPPSFRKKALHRYAELIEENASELDLLDAGEMGKPIRESFCNAAAAAGMMRFYAEAVDKVQGELYGSDSFSLVAQRLVPRGVVGAIVPWNFPTYVAALKLSPALAAGNSVVLKPSEMSTRSAILLAHLAVDAGIPPGVLNVVPGLGEIVGRALGLHGDVDMLTFTGSTAVGKLMLQYAGQSNMKVVKAECGGKSPHVVFADGVDVKAAGQFIARAMLTNQGQICSVGSRLLVHRSIEERMIEAVSSHFERVVMGDARDPTTTYGPISSATQCERVMQYIESGARDGATLVSGGRRVPRTNGYFVEPTLFRSVPATARIAQEEIFGPVLSVIPFDDEQEAISVANQTSYGLLAYVWTANLGTAMRVSKSIRSGVIVNELPPKGEGAGYGFSFEPSRQSGVGVEGGLPGFESYFRRQLMRFNHA